MPRALRSDGIVQQLASLAATVLTAALCWLGSGRANAIAVATLTALPAYVASVPWTFDAESCGRAWPCRDLSCDGHCAVGVASGRARAGMRARVGYAMAALRTWSGLPVCWIMLLVFSYGTASYYKDAITLWMSPELRGAAAHRVAPFQAAKVALAQLRLRAPGAPSC